MSPFDKEVFHSALPNHSAADDAKLVINKLATGELRIKVFCSLFNP